jgi:AraC family transcriptional regulator of adaptative response / DNA-3-methyladenine glycosylase II
MTVGVELDREVCYRAWCARDARCDGRFFVARTTGIFCRPICAARTPHLRDVEFFASAAAALAAGFRPCLRCRPECAPESFAQHLGASPLAVAQSRRVLLANQLLHETRMSMTAIAAAAGFGSVRR